MRGNTWIGLKGKLVLEWVHVSVLMVARKMTDAERDQTLIAGIAARQRTSFAEIYDRHAGQMLAVAIRILRNRRDAEDLVHDVFIEVWHKAQDYDPRRGSVRSWLLMRVRSRSIDRVRSLAVARKHGMAQASDDAPDTRSSPNPDRLAECSHARRAVSRLSEAQRRIVELIYFEGLTCQETAAQCAIPVGTVKSRLSSALTKLRAELVPVHGN